MCGLKFNSEQVEDFSNGAKYGNFNGCGAKSGQKPGKW